MKKILLISVIPGNMEEIYNARRKNFDIELFEAYKYINNRMVGRIKKLKLLFHKYDLVIADYPTRLLNKGKKSIYMDHGSGLKLMPGKYEINNKDIVETSKAISKSSCFFIQAEREKDVLYSWLPYIEEKINFLEIGQPRIDRLFNHKFLNKRKEENKKKYFKFRNKKIVLLAPTWRGYKCDFNNIFSNEKLNVLNNFLEKNEMILVYRPHYLETGIDIKKIEEMENMMIIDNEEEADVQNILPSVDILISDYSGIVTEFLALDRPIVFLDVDVAKYDKYRGLAINFYNDIHTPGKKVQTSNELILALEELKKTDGYKIQREKAKKYYYKYYDGNSTQRIWEYIEKSFG